MVDTQCLLEEKARTKMKAVSGLRHPVCHVCAAADKPIVHMKMRERERERARDGTDAITREENAIVTTEFHDFIGKSALIPYSLDPSIPPA